MAMGVSHSQHQRCSPAPSGVANVVTTSSTLPDSLSPWPAGELDFDVVAKVDVVVSVWLSTATNVVFLVLISPLFDLVIRSPLDRATLRNP